MSNDDLRTMPVGRVLVALLDRDLAVVQDKPKALGGALPGSVSDLYVRLERVGGSGDLFGGDYVVDVETFSPSFTKAESAQFDIEALLFRYPHVVEVGDPAKVWIIDRVSQNQGAAEIFWDDDNVTRLLATYVITARRR